MKRGKNQNSFSPFSTLTKHEFRGQNRSSSHRPAPGRRCSRAGTATLDSTGWSSAAAGRTGWCCATLRGSSAVGGQTGWCCATLLGSSAVAGRTGCCSATPWTLLNRGSTLRHQELWHLNSNSLVIFLLRGLSDKQFEVELKMKTYKILKMYSFS